MSKSTAEQAAAAMSANELAQAQDVCERSAATLASVLDELHGVDILGSGTFGPKIVSRIELAAERLAWAATFYGRQLEKVGGAPEVDDV